MPLEIDFLCDFGGFLVEKWRQVGTNMDPKSMCNAKSDYLKKLRFSVGKTILLHILEVKVGIKYNEKSMTK